MLQQHASKRSCRGLRHARDLSRSEQGHTYIPLRTTVPSSHEVSSLQPSLPSSAHFGAGSLSLA